jgi:exodeoxyribonuclease-3
MKITTWNVNGYRAITKKNFIDSIQFLSPDILCLQEIKAREDQLTPEEIKIPGHNHIWHSAERPGYSGVATYIKEELIYANKIGLGFEEFDREGRVIQIFFDKVILYNIYFPNGQRGQERVDYKLNFYGALLKKCLQDRLDGRSVIITGDFNTAHTKIDLANPKENEKTSGFLPVERDMISKFIENGFIDAYRILYPDRKQYTWWTYRFNARPRGIGWRLDYYLISDELSKSVNDVIIHDEIGGSDHCPVTLDIDLKNYS